jgi:hypothetical protein
MQCRGVSLASITLTLLAVHPTAQLAAQQSDTAARRGWGIVYSSPRSRQQQPAAAATTPAPAPTPPPPAPTPTVLPTTVLPTIRGTTSTPPPTATYAPPAATGGYAGDQPPAASAAHPNGTYAGDRVPAPDTLPPAPSYGGTAAPATNAPATNAPAMAQSPESVHLDELMSLHEYTSSGLTTLKPAEVATLEKWLDRYRTTLVDSVTRAAQQHASTRSLVPAPQSPAAAALTTAARNVVPANAHAVTGIRSGSRYIQIDDGSVWDIYPADQSETAAWQPGDYVVVRLATSAYGEFDHELVNNQRTGPVRAKFMGYARADTSR